MAKRHGAKTKAKSKAKAKAKNKGSRRRVIWAVGAVPFPIPIDDARGPVRLMLCVLRPSLHVLQHAISDAPTDDAHAANDEIVAMTRQAITDPLFGRPETPDKIFVADEGLAAQLREAFPTIEVAVGATPEVARIAEAMRRGMGSPQGGSQQASYVAGGASPKTVARFFEAAAELFEAAPWALLTEEAVLRVDVPQLGMTEMRGVVIGDGMGEAFGLMMFPTDDAYEAFLDVMSHVGDIGPRMSLRVSYIALTFDPPGKLPPRLVEEVRRFGWAPPHADAIPWVTRVDAGEPTALLSERDALLMTLAARALTRLVVDEEPVLLGDADWLGPISGRASHAGLDVVVTLDELEGLAVFDEDELFDEDVGIDPRHQLDVRLVARMRAFADRELGDAWRLHEEMFAPHPSLSQLVVPWSVYEHCVEGRRVIDHFLDAHGSELDDEERAWLAAQTRSWLSVWEVVAVDRGVGITLRDLLTGEVREVREVAASRVVPLREAILARVVDGGTASLSCGLHPRTLPPRVAAAVVDALKKQLRAKGDVAIARMRDPETAIVLLTLWQAAVQADDDVRAQPQVLHNTDGEPFLLTVDRYRLATSDVTGIEDALSALPSVFGPALDDEDRDFVVSKPGNALHHGWDNTTIGTIRVLHDERRLEIETNSVARADRLRAMVEDALGARIAHQARTHQDPTSSKARDAARDSKARRPATPPNEDEQRQVNAVVRDMKERHYATWLDHPLPALGGATPRKAARTKKGRQELDLLLREIERGESMQPEPQRFDVSALRRELGLPS